MRASGWCDGMEGPAQYWSCFTRDCPNISKLTESIFLGNEIAAQDSDFISNNKVGLIVNASPGELVPINQADSCNILDFKINQLSVNQLIKAFPLILGSILAKIQECRTVLLCSRGGRSRCVVLGCIYLMSVHNWCLSSALQLIVLQHSNSHPTKEWLQVLGIIESEYLQDHDLKFISEETIPSNELDSILIHTFLNSRRSQKNAFDSSENDKVSNRRQKIKSQYSSNNQKSFKNTLKKVRFDETVTVINGTNIAYLKQIPNVGPQRKKGQLLSQQSKKSLSLMVGKRSLQNGMIKIRLNQSVGTQTTNRNVGAQATNRNVGAQTTNRNVGAQATNRNVGAQTTNRNQIRIKSRSNHTIRPNKKEELFRGQGWSEGHVSKFPLKEYLNNPGTTRQDPNPNYVLGKDIRLNTMGDDWPERKAKWKVTKLARNIQF